MDNGEQRHDTDFPIREQVEEYAGRMRTFMISCDEVGLGFTVRAREKGRRGLGYEFAAYSETSPYSALGRVRQKMYRALAKRHITGSRGQYRMLHDRMSGRIAWDEQRGIVLVVDGIALAIDDLEAILASHEGWEFELEIVSALE